MPFVVNFDEHFTLEPDGSWRCLRKTFIYPPARRIEIDAGMRFTRGTQYDGCDVAQWLDDVADISRELDVLRGVPKGQSG